MLIAVAGIGFSAEKTVPSAAGNAGAEEKTSVPDDAAYKHLSTFMEALLLIRNMYPDTEKVSYEKLFQGAIRGMVHSLDPFSNYENAKAYKMTKEDTKGEFPGVGIVLTKNGSRFMVVSVLRNSPAQKAGLLPGDRLLEANGIKLGTQNLNECVGILKGPAGTKIKMKYYRPSKDLTKEITMERSVIQVSSVKGVGMLDGKIGYLRITNFTASTARDLDRALEKLTKDGMEGLIIDLRNNPGGLLNAGIEVSSRFLKKGKLVVSVEGRSAKTQKYESVDCKQYLELPVILLVNRNTASAAEILAGCLKDYHRGILVGEKTFGKGSVQSMLPLGDSGALRLTTAKYYTPGRLVIHGNGIEPNIRLETSPAETFEVAVHLNKQDDLPPKMSEKQYRDRALIRAAEILKGIQIYRKFTGKE